MSDFDPIYSQRVLISTQYGAHIGRYLGVTTAKVHNLIHQLRDVERYPKGSNIAWITSTVRGFAIDQIMYTINETKDLIDIVQTWKIQTHKRESLIRIERFPGDSITIFIRRPNHTLCDSFRGIPLKACCVDVLLSSKNEIDHFSNFALYHLEARGVECV